MDQPNTYMISFHLNDKPDKFVYHFIHKFSWTICQTEAQNFSLGSINFQRFSI